jgi:hypothetical protein
VRTPGKVTAAVAGTLAAIAVLPGSANALALGITTKSVEDVSSTSVTLKAEANVPVLGAQVTWQWGASTTYGQTTRPVATSLIGLVETLTLPVAGLAPDTSYHVRAVASSGLTTSYGRDVSFKTAKDKDDDDSSGSGSSGSGSSGSGSSGSGSSGSSGSGSSGSGSGTTTSGGTTTSDDSSSSTGKDKDKSKDKDKDKSDGGSGSGSAAPAVAADPAADVPRGSATAAVTPVLGRTLAAAAVQGTVTATDPSGAPVDLSAAQAVPTGTLIDTRAGTVELTTALARKGAKQTGRFWGGLFEVRQSPTAGGLTQLVLRGVDWHACRATVARAATNTTKKKKPARSLWGSDDHGRFQTRGRGSVATVRGTRWVTHDSCQGTVTRVTSGAVAVRDFGADRTVVVRAGHQYQARVAQ